MNEINLIFRDNMKIEMDKIKDKFPNAKFYSHSRLGNFNQCKRGYYYTYVDKKPQKTGVYSTLGTACHTSLEEVYEGKCDIPNKEIFESEFLKCELFNITFPKSKYDIKGGYYKDISAFYDVYKKIDSDGKFISELGFIFKIDDLHYEIGYIDLLILNKDGTADIIDFKTSSTFDKKHTIEAGRQLVLYAMVIEQLYGIKVNTVSWQMLKYVDVQVGDNKPKLAVKGREWVSKSSTQIKTLMKKNGYDEMLIEMYLSQAIVNNNISKLPNDIREQIKVDVHRRYYDITENIKSELLEYTNKAINEIETMDMNDINKWECSVDQFFCENLCSFSNTYCNYKLYLEK